jgi:hypothetical protein
MFEDLIAEAAKRHHLDPAILLRLAQAESGATNATGRAGELGPMQLMPATAQGLGVKDPRDPAQNIEGGAGYLQQLLAQNGGDYRRALTAYNWGPGNLAKAAGDVTKAPAATQSYVQQIVGGQKAAANVPPTQQTNDQLAAARYQTGADANRGGLPGLLAFGGMPPPSYPMAPPVDPTVAALQSLKQQFTV